MKLEVQEQKALMKGLFLRMFRKNVAEFHLRGKLILRELNLLERVVLWFVGVKEMNAMRKTTIKPIVDFLKKK